MTDVVETWRCILSKHIPIKGTPWTIVGDSRAARHTMFIIPELRVAFDAGKESEQHPTHIFISHAHCDHTKGLPALLLEPNGIPIVVVPKPSANSIRKLVNSYHQSTKYNDTFTVKWKLYEASVSTTDPPEKQHFLQEMVKVNDTYELIDVIFKIKNMDFKVEMFKSTHTIPTTAYGLIEQRKKLVDKLVGKSQDEINAAKERGELISKIIEIAHIVNLGDTTHHVFYLNKQCTIPNPNLEKYGTIIVECTFLGDTKEEIKQAKEKKHIHWDNLKPYIESHPNTNFILSHFSVRYTSKEIGDFFSKINLPNVFPLFHDFEQYWMNRIFEKVKEDETGELLKKLNLFCQECKKSTDKITVVAQFDDSFILENSPDAFDLADLTEQHINENFYEE
jgi:ribonuclease Z